jgi:hypothetical protein
MRIRFSRRWRLQPWTINDKSLPGSISCVRAIHHTRCPHTRARGGRAGRPSRMGRGCAEQSDWLEPPGRRSGCWLTSPFLFSGIVVRRFRVGATMELGGSGRSMMMMMMSAGAGAARATGSSTTDRKIAIHHIAAPCSLSRISGCRDRGLYPLARPRAERHLLPAPLSF